MPFLSGISYPRLLKFRQCYGEECSDVAIHEGESLTRMDSRGLPQSSAPPSQ